MRPSVLRKIKDDFHISTHFSLMAYVVTDASNREKLSFTYTELITHLSYMKNLLDFTKLRLLLIIITDALSDILQWMNLSVSNYCGQCYGEASNVSGIR